MTDAAGFRIETFSELKVFVCTVIIGCFYGWKG